MFKGHPRIRYFLLCHFWTLKSKILSPRQLHHVWGLAQSHSWLPFIEHMRSSSMSTCPLLKYTIYIMLSLSPLCLKPLTLLGCPHNAALSIDLSGTWYFLSTAENVQPQTRQTFHLGILQNCDPKLMICSVRFAVENQYVWVDVRYFSMSLGLSLNVIGDLISFLFSTADNF